jgi:MtN3 and saliva related transmembrane protein
VKQENDMSAFVTAIGLAAAICTTAANVPQLIKAWSTQETDDLSLKMLALLSVGLGLWIAYGVLKSDWVIILANGIGLVLAIALVSLKLFYGLRQTGQS